MPFSISILPDYVHVEWQGDLHNCDLQEVGRTLPGIAMQLGKVPNVLHTFDKVEALHLEFDAMHAHTRELSRAKLPNKSRSAFFCDRPISYGVARMMQSMNSNPDLQMEVFESLDKAIEWLKGPI